MGHKLSASGISPDQEKINTILNLQTPTNVKELRSFLGMITYCSRFIPNFATIIDPLRSLLKKDSDWVWTEIISTIQKAVIETMAYYDLNSYTKIVTDVPLLVFCAVIAQRQPDGTLRPISYASRSGKHYSQIEKEALGIVFAIERF